jgi:hypothetical protein
MMNALLKTGLILGLAVAAVIAIALYGNYHLYSRALSEPVLPSKIVLLEKAESLYPFNALVDYELGKAQFDLGMQNLQDPDLAESHFRSAVQCLRRSLNINPTSPYSHYFLGQALLHMDFFIPVEDEAYLAEFEKAAALAGDDSQIYGEVGKVYLSRWPQLSPEKREFTLTALQRIMNKKDREKTAALFQIWELNGTDYALMDEILPEDARVYRQYAEFLGKRALSLGERIRYLSRAESLDFAEAQVELRAGEELVSRFQTRAALDHLSKALKLLRGIRFYQALQGETLIVPGEYSGLLKSVLWGVVRNRVELGAKLAEVESELREYLDLEDQPARIAELEDYLREKRVIDVEFGRSLEDLDLLAFDLLLQYKQARYREIVNFGRRLEKSFLVVPVSEQDAYVRLLNILGDSLEKTGFLYEAGDVFRRARQVDPENLGTLLRIRRNSDKLNEIKGVEEIARSLDKMLTPARTDFSNFRLKQGQSSEHVLVLEGKGITLDLYFEEVPAAISPLITIVFNARVVYEDYLKESAISVTVATKPGENVLQMRSVNSDLSLVRMSYRVNPENAIAILSGRPE